MRVYTTDRILFIFYVCVYTEFAIYYVFYVFTDPARNSGRAQKTRIIPIGDFIFFPLSLTHFASRRRAGLD